MILDIDRTLFEIKQKLVGLIPSAERNEMMQGYIESLKDAVALIGDLETRIQEMPPVDLDRLTTSEFKVYDMLRRAINAKPDSGIQKVMANATIRLRRYGSMAAVLYQEPKFKDTDLESVERIKAQFELWLFHDEDQNGCRGLSTLETDQMREAWIAAAAKYQASPRKLEDSEIVGVCYQNGIKSIGGYGPEELTMDQIRDFSQTLIKLAAS